MFVNNGIGAVDDVGLFLFRQSKLLLQFLRPPEIIAIQECHIIAPAQIQAPVSGSGHTHVLFVAEKPDAAVFPGHILYDRAQRSGEQSSGTKSSQFP